MIMQYGYYRENIVNVAYSHSSVGAASAIVMFACEDTAALQLWGITPNYFNYRGLISYIVIACRNAGGGLTGDTSVTSQYRESMGPQVTSRVNAFARKIEVPVGTTSIGVDCVLDCTNWTGGIQRYITIPRCSITVLGARR